MKQGAPRGGTVDGIRKDSLIEIAKAVEATDCALSNYIRHHGVEFTYHGHKIVLDPPNRYNVRGGHYIEPEESLARRKPVNALDCALKARCNYNEDGVAARGLLMRRVP